MLKASEALERIGENVAPPLESPIPAVWVQEGVGQGLGDRGIIQDSYCWFSGNPLMGESFCAWGPHKPRASGDQRTELIRIQISPGE